MTSCDLPGAAAGSGVLAILYLLARREQCFLEAEFGTDNPSYATRGLDVPPQPRALRHRGRHDLLARAIGRNLRDALAFLAAISLADVAKMARSHFYLIQTCRPDPPALRLRRSPADRASALGIFPAGLG